METTKFGYIGRGSLPYILIYHNVFLTKKEGNKDTENYETELICITDKDNILSKNIDVGVKIEEINKRSLRYTSNESRINFTVTIDKNTYIRTFKANNKILFECKYDPQELFIRSKGMDIDIDVTQFVDH
jgi:hypothetical protein